VLLWEPGNRGDPTNIKRLVCLVVDSNTKKEKHRHKQLLYKCNLMCNLMTRNHSLSLDVFSSSFASCAFRS